MAMTALMMEAVYTSETSEHLNETKRSFLPESCHVHARHRENLKSNIQINK
jgi:hypothetical protein